LALSRSSMVTTYITECDVDMDADSVAPKHHNQRPDSSTIGLALPRHPFVAAEPSGTAPCAYSTFISPSFGGVPAHLVVYLL
jgi:hypothetical protein